MIAIELAKAVGGPGSNGFLALGCAVGLFIIYVWPKRRAAGRWWLFGLYSSYLVLGIPALAHRVAAPLAFQPMPIDGRMDTLIVFGGDNSVGRVQETVRVWRAQAPGAIIVSGEDWFIGKLMEAGIPAGRMRQDEASSTTREQVDFVSDYAATHPDERLAVVCSRLQARRVELLLRAAALDVSVIASPIDREPATTGIRRFVPTYAGLRVTRDAFYERLALAYYARNGWIQEVDRTTTGTRRW